MRKLWLAVLAVLAVGCQAPAKIRVGVEVGEKALEALAFEADVLAADQRLDLSIAYDKRADLIVRRKLYQQRGADGKLDVAAVEKLLREGQARRKEGRLLVQEWAVLAAKVQENATIARKIWRAVAVYLNSGLSERDRAEMQSAFGQVGQELLERQAREAAERAKRKAEAERAAKEEEAE